MKRISIFAMILSLFLFSCKIPGTAKGAAFEVRIVTAPEIVDTELGDLQDQRVSVFVENFTDTTDFNEEFGTAYLSYYEVKIVLEGREISFKKVPANMILKPGATMEISVILVSKEEKLNILKEYGNVNSLIGYSIVIFHFKDAFENVKELSYKPVLRMYF